MDTFDIVDDYFCKVCEMPEAELCPASRAIVEVWHSSGLIGNAGMHGYMCMVGDSGHDLAGHYRFAGLDGAADLIVAAVDLWRRYWLSGDPQESDPDDFRSQFSAQLDRIESEFDGLKDGFSDKLAEIVPNSNEVRYGLTKR